MTKSNFEGLSKPPIFARPPRQEEGANPVKGYGAVRFNRRPHGPPDRAHGAICDRGVGRIQEVDEGAGRLEGQDHGGAA